MHQSVDYIRAIACVAVASAIVPGLAAWGQGTVVATESTPDSPQSVIVVKTPPPTPEEIADALMMHQRYRAAIDEYKKGPLNSADLWNKMGIAYQMMFAEADATRCYQESLRLDPMNTHVLNNLGTIYDSAREYSSAERMYRKALKIDPNSAVTEKNLGTNLLAQHKYKKGWAAYQAALSIDSHVLDNNTSPRVDNPSTAQNRGAMNYFLAKGCALAGMTDRAIDYLRMSLNEGFANPKKIIADNEFSSLRGVPAFKQLLAAQSN
jgi:Tfp pilus assembly protein PilF